MKERIRTEEDTALLNSIADTLNVDDGELRDSFNTNDSFHISDAGEEVQTKVTLEDGKIHFNHTQDVEAILNHNAALRGMGSGMTKDKSIKRVASIPHVIVLEWKKEGLDIINGTYHGEGGKTFERALRRKLNDPDNRMFRTSEGNL